MSHTSEYTTQWCSGFYWAAKIYVVFTAKTATGCIMAQFNDHFRNREAYCSQCYIKSVMVLKTDTVELGLGIYKDYLS